jgi:hypothetical protein
MLPDRSAGCALEWSEGLRRDRAATEISLLQFDTLACNPAVVVAGCMERKSFRDFSIVKGDPL